MAWRGPFASVFVVETVFSGNERRFKSDCGVVTSLCGHDQRSERVRLLGISPTKVVEEGDSGWVRAHCHAVANGLVDHAGSHRVRVQPGVARVDSASDRQSTSRTPDGKDHGRVGGTVLKHAHERLDDGSRLNLVVVLVDDPGFTANVVRSKDHQQIFIELLGLRSGRNPRGDELGSREFRPADDLWPAFVEKLHRQVGDHATLVTNG